MPAPERGLSFRRIGRAALAATLTTVVGLAGLAVAVVRALRELGGLTSGVLLLVCLTYALAWPGFVALTSARVRARPRERTPGLIDRLLVGAPWVFWSGMLLAFALVANAGQLRFHDVPRGVELALLSLGPLLWLTFGNARLALLAGAPPLLSLAMTLGVMPLLGLELDHLNVIILPMLLGIGVHGGARLVAQLDEGKPLRAATWRNGLAVSGSLVSTALGFALLLMANHPGLSSIAQVALLGLSLNVLVTVVLLPMLLALFEPRQSGVVAQVATCFGAGRARWAPGSLGALLALPAAWLMRELSGAQLLLLIGALTLASTLAVQRYLAGRKRDPQEVVVDEWIGCLITLAFVPFSAAWVVAGYLLFRMFDIFKPGPIRWLDRRVHGGLGVMADDVAAGLAAGAVLALARLAALG